MPEPHDAELIVRESDTVTHWIAVYREHFEVSKAIAASLDLDAPLIAETARHAGHADIIRETLDGSRGI
jgi:hypothetical protein